MYVNRDTCNSCKDVCTILHKMPSLMMPCFMDLGSRTHQIEHPAQRSSAAPDNFYAALANGRVLPTLPTVWGLGMDHSGPGTSMRKLQS